MGQKDELLFNSLARMAERRLDQFNAQGLANTAWALATDGTAGRVFNAFARMAARRLDQVNAQELANTA